MSMTVRLIVLALVLLWFPTVALAAPQEDLLARLIEIAEPDQVDAFLKLNLSESQEAELLTLARNYVPQLQSAKGQPVRLMGLVSQALADADTVLTPSQRPLIRKLVPRPHQWEQLKRLSSEV